MHIKIVNAFVEAAHAVLAAEAQLQITRGEMELSGHAYTTDEVTVMIGLMGQIKGTVLYSLTEVTALDLVGRLMDEPFHKFNTLAQSGIAELGNVISGQAITRLTELGFTLFISPPTLLIGSGVFLSTLDLPLLSIPLRLPHGQFGLHLALRETDIASDRLSTQPLGAGQGQSSVISHQ